MGTVRRYLLWEGNISDLKISSGKHTYIHTKRKGQILTIMDPEICYAQVRTCKSVPGMKLVDLELKAAHV